MNRTPSHTSFPLLQRPARLAGVLVGAVLLLLGGVPLAERVVAHLTVWTATVPVPGLAHLLLFAAGAAALAWARSNRTRARRTGSQER
ncbi:hypothetical protein [Streptomyces sp. NPDC000133]|uniref:hypothetical protein n=1 Tax=Streptomyces sp. NPDC000133 TaxID=3364535 RepID=UPI0036931A04